MNNEWVALITDQHFGVRNNSQVFLDYYFKFYEETFFPTLKKYGVDEIIDLGVSKLYLDNPDPSNNWICFDKLLINWIPLSTEIVSFSRKEIFAAILSEIKLSESSSIAEYISLT